MGCGCGGKSFASPQARGGSLNSSVAQQIPQSGQSPQARVVASQNTPYGTAPVQQPMKRVSV